MTRTHGGVPPLFIIGAGILALSLSGAAPASAQTPFGQNARQVSVTPPGRTSAPARAANGTAQPAGAPVEAPSMPVSKTVIKQASRQIEGQFPAMARAGVGGQVQDAWNASSPRDGVQTFRLCDNCVYKVRLREFMATTIILPEDAEIVTADLGDPTAFQVKVKSVNMIAVRPASYGLDTNLNVYSKSGAVYPFYLRAESFNSENVPDVVVKIIGRETPPKIESVTSGIDPSKPETAGEDAPADVERQGEGEGDAGKDGEDKETRADKVAAAVDALTNPKADEGDFVRTIPFDPSKLHGWHNYKLWGDDELAPPKDRNADTAVFRDDQFTYIQYGKKWDSLELPTAYVVIDGIDELVNTRVKGTTFIIEAIAPLISLKDGKKFLCIEYTGENP